MCEDGQSDDNSQGYKRDIEFPVGSQLLLLSGGQYKRGPALRQSER